MASGSSDAASRRAAPPGCPPRGAAPLGMAFGSSDAASGRAATLGCPPRGAAPSGMASGSSDAGKVFRWPASILLAEEAYVAATRNDTTAQAISMEKHTVEITFWIADPPAVSFYTFYATNSDAKDVRTNSVIAGAHGRFVLVRTLFAGDDQYEYFVYKGHPKSPSLESIPLPYDDNLNGVEFGIVPHGDDGHYLLIALRDTLKNDYWLHIYSSHDTRWRTKDLPNPCPEVRTIMPNKVFTLGDGLLLWVDLMQGILICDVLAEPSHCAQYIPLPEPLPGNREKLKKFVTGVRSFRDLTCVDGLIKFIEIDQRVIVREITEDVPPEKPTKDVLYDSELIMLSKRKPVENKPKMQRSANGWSATMWTREIGSNCWLKGSVVDANDVLVDESVFSALLSSKKRESAGDLIFKSLYSIWPTLSMDGNAILYLKLFNRQLGVSVLSAVDLVEKTLTVEAPGVHSFGKHSCSRQILRPCALANQLKMTLGIKVSASQIALIGSSANEPNSTATRVGEPDSYERNKRPRLLAEKVNHAQNRAQGTVQNVLSSKAHPNQNKMPPRLCFNRYKKPRYSGNISWPHQNNPPLQPPSCFNNWAGPYNHVYAPSAPAPNVQSYANYQSLPQQLPLQEQQATPSMVFGPHMTYGTPGGMEGGVRAALSEARRDLGGGAEGVVVGSRFLVSGFGQ